MEGVKLNRFILAALLLFAPPALAVEGVPVSREWTPAGFGGAGTYSMITYDLGVSGLVYLVSDVAGNLYSTDEGAQWRFMNKGTTTIINAAIAQAPSNHDILYSIGKKIIKSVNGGRSWSTLGAYIAIRPENYKSIAIDKDDANIAYFGLRDGRIVYTTNGQDIEVFDTPFAVNEQVSFIYFNPDETRMLVGSWGSGMVYYDMSVGAASKTAVTFAGTNSLYNGDFGTYDNSGTEVLCVPGGHVIQCTSDTDTFGSWTPTVAAHTDAIFFISRMAVKKTTGGTLKFITYMRRTTSAGGSNYWDLSNDGGATWTAINNNITLDPINNPTEPWASFGDLGNAASVAFDPHSDTKAAITTDWRIWFSEDGGLNWIERVKGAQNTVISDVFCGPSIDVAGTKRCFQMGMDQGILYSDDLGDHWTATFPNAPNGGAQGFSKAGHVWAGVPRGDATAWQAGTGGVTAMTSNWADFIPRAIVSNDNGQTWTISNSGLPTVKITYPNYSSTRAYVVGEHALGSNGNLYTCIQDSTGNTPQSSPLYWELHARAKHAAAWGIGYPRALAKCPANDSILAVGIDGISPTQDGGIFISTDGGLNWARTPANPEQWKTYNGISFDPTDATCNTIEFGEFFYDEPDVAKTWRTTDRGSNWLAVNNDIGIYDLRYASDGKVYKVGLDTNPMIDRSLDGITWTTLKKLNATAQIANGLSIHPVYPNRICVGVDDGVNTKSSDGSEGINNDDSTGAAGGSIYCTGDGGVKWYNISGDLPSPSGITAITHVNYRGIEWLLIGTDGSGVFRLPAKDKARTTMSNVRFLNP